MEEGVAVATGIITTAVEAGVADVVGAAATHDTVPVAGLADKDLPPGMSLNSLDLYHLLRSLLLELPVSTLMVPLSTHSITQRWEWEAAGTILSILCSRCSRSSITRSAGISILLFSPT